MFKRVARKVLGELRSGANQHAADHAHLASQLEALQRGLQDVEVRLQDAENRLAHGFHLPDRDLLSDVSMLPFMAYSSCHVDDFLSPEFDAIIRSFDHPLVWQRKLWEWVFVIHHLKSAGVLRPGCRGLVFGVGSERLPSLFASLGAQITATDAPPDLAVKSGWAEFSQHASNLNSLFHPAIVERAVFDHNVSFEVCDMNQIDPHFRDYDFCWSSCCFEHLGSLEAGMEFVLNSVENTLKHGGVAVHTTELNLSSNDETVATGATVLYRKRDFDDLLGELRRRGHFVKPFRIAPNAHFNDYKVDIAPYRSDPHLKLQLMGHVATSAGVVIRKGCDF